ncbi:MAG TPA: response regulator [Anaerolineae bacterium]
MSQERTILIVDDHPIGRETLEGLLYNEGYELSFASNGAEALEKATTLTPDLILLDVMMPDMNGFEVCRRIRTDPLLFEIPIIMVTALDDYDSLIEGIKAGADDFVSKPFDSVELRARVRTITRLNRYRRLLSERTKFKWVVEQASNGYIIIDDQDQILYSNPQARLYLNLTETQDEVPAETFLALARAQYQCEPQEAWAGWPETFDIQQIYYLVRPASPSTNPFWLRVELMNMDPGLGEQYLVCLTDVTESIIEQRTRWTFHGQISHKMRTPLGHVIAAFEALDEAEFESLPPQVRNLLDIARNGAMRLKHEVQDIFQYVEASSLAGFDHGQCSLAEISDMIGRIKSDLRLKPVIIRYDGVETPDQSYIALSSRAMELVLWELVENAKKFHPKKSPALEIRLSCWANEAQIKVCDDGVTLRPDQLAKMWTPYYQVEKFFTGEVAGTGLGLATVTSVIWSVGGTCRAYNQKDRAGIIVELSLPLQNGPGSDSSNGQS